MTLDEIMAKATELAQKYPDNIYLGTEYGGSYLHGKNTEYPGEGCIFGQIIDREGLDSIEGKNMYVVAQKLLGIPKNEAFDNKQVDWCYNLQYLQDNRKTWGEALVRANELLSLD